ncbi:hypothetical protein HPP92_000402 [Vanilla planifolia]|uniref:type I protein arginine methyltransferase n=1 Tax=Vanilla planifolia TaxID=51239 RepID=A0A835RP39_VANPL|nr:hypothetical protein HPP92_000402 [Vanilla planifolia]
MEVSCERKPRHHREYPYIEVTELNPSPSSARLPPEATASFSADESGAPQLRLCGSDSRGDVCYVLRSCQVFSLGPLETLVAVEETGGSDTKENSFSKAYKLIFRTQDMQKAFIEDFRQWKHGIQNTQNGPMENGSRVATQSKFDNKIEASSAKMYFHYYGQLLHQQNMLQDYVRTAFEIAINLVAIALQVIKGKIEEVELPEKADILISEPMGTLLVNERMLETYVIARDRFLLPDGKMFPSVGRIHMAPFSDEYLFVEIANKALFWQQQNFYGVDLTPLYGSAFQGYFSQPVVDAFDPRLLVSLPTFHVLDFSCIKEEDLYEIDIPLNFIASVGTRVHGLACWFDVLFNGSSFQRWLTTSPGSPTTHWYQMRCVLSQPLYVMAGQEITGRLHLVAHSAQSYTIHLTMSVKMWGAGANHGGIMQTSTGKLELKEPYYRLSQPQPYIPTQDQQLHQQLVTSQDGNLTSLCIQQSQNSGNLASGNLQILKYSNV